MKYILTLIVIAACMSCNTIQQPSVVGQDKISFTLKNASSKSIPLRIPGVMNPNLSPFSKSGVTLAIGQKVIYRIGGKSYLLLEVDDRIKSGEVIEVSELVQELVATL